MFKANELVVKDWCQHRSKTIKFVPGTNGVVGTNGKGKSNLVGALFTAITGRVMVDDIKDNINFESDKAIIDLKFTQDGVDGVLRRSFTGTRIEGDSRNRKDVSSTAKLTYGTMEVSKPAPVTDAMLKLTGMSPRVIEDHIFVSQDRIQELLFQRKSDRMNSFLTLIPGVERAKIAHAALQTELVSYPEVTLATNLEETKNQLLANRAEQMALAGKSEEITQQLKSLDIAQILSDEARIRAAANLDVTLSRVNYQAEQAAKECDTLMVLHVDADTALSDALRVVESKRPGVETARSEIRGYAQSQAVYTTRKRAQEEQDKLLADIAVIDAPADNGKPWTELPKLEEEQAVLMAKLQEHVKVVDMLKLGDNCPTCARPFEKAATERIKHGAHAEECRWALKELRTKIDDLKSAERKYTAAMNTYITWVDTAQAKLTTLGETLASLPDVPEPNAERFAQLTALVKAFDAAQAAVEPLERKSRDTQTRLTSETSRLNALKDQQEELEKELADRPTPEQIATVKALHGQHERLTAESSVVDGKLSAKKDEQHRLEESILKVDMLADRAGKVLAYRRLLTDVREVLHRDRLPNAVLGTYVQQLDRLCNKFLDLFGNPFAVTLDRDMEMACRFPNGYDCSTTRLSGGQKCVLSVAMRFAINELFAKDLGLLVLDEPSAFMDPDNVAYLGDLMDYIQRAGKASGVQTIIITHAQDLVSHFENCIVL